MEAELLLTDVPRWGNRLRQTLDFTTCVSALLKKEPILDAIAYKFSDCIPYAVFYCGCGRLSFSRN